MLNLVTLDLERLADVGACCFAFGLGVGEELGEGEMSLPILDNGNPLFRSCRAIQGLRAAAYLLKSH